MVTEDIAARVRSYIQHQGTKSSAALIDLVGKSQQRYLAVVGSVADDVASRKPAPDEWSLRELILHVIAAEDSVADIVSHISRGTPPPPSERQRGMGMTIDDPGVGFPALVEQLRGVNAKLIAALRDLPESPNLEMTIPHPFFGELNCREWAVFQRVHDEDHVQHSQKILAAVAT